MRSDDAQTKCGAIITDKHNTVISTGFNGFVRGGNTSILPNTRPKKYDYMQHAEHNAIINCARSGVSTLDGIIYVSGKPCLYCYQDIMQAGISKVYYTNYSQPKMTKKAEKAYNLFLKSHGDIRVFIEYQVVQESFLRVERSLDTVYNIFAGT